MRYTLLLDAYKLLISDYQVKLIEG